jgi:hypothetical protein
MATGRIGVTPNLGIRWSKVPTGGTTSLSGNDDNSVPLAYSAGYEAVYRNGVLLSRGNDYTATDGTSITLVDATITGDLIEVFANQTVALTDTYSQSAANAKFINNTLTTTTGDIIYASAANTPARLGIGSTSQVLTVSGGVPAWGAAPSPTFVGCLAEASVQQTISNATYTVMNLGGADIYDTNSFHNPSTNSSRITIPSGYAGYYLLIGTVGWKDNATGERQTGLKKNGTSLNQPGVFSSGNAGGGNFTTNTCIGIINLSVGDYVEIEGRQYSGGNLNTQYVQFVAQFLGA